MKKSKNQKVKLKIIRKEKKICKNKFLTFSKMLQKKIKIQLKNKNKQKF